MEKRDASSLIQVVTLFAMVAFFIWESRSLEKEDLTVFWIFMGVIFFIFIVFSLFYYLSDKMRQININTLEIRKLKEQISFRKSLEEMNYKLGKIEGESLMKKRGVLNPNQLLILVIIVIAVLYLLWKSGFFG